LRITPTLFLLKYSLVAALLKACTRHARTCVTQARVRHVCVREQHTPCTRPTYTRTGHIAPNSKMLLINVCVQSALAFIVCRAQTHAPRVDERCVSSFTNSDPSLAKRFSAGQLGAVCQRQSMWNQRAAARADAPKVKLTEKQFGWLTEVWNCNVRLVCVRAHT
jgi:hypothetical protein